MKETVVRNANDSTNKICKKNHLAIKMRHAPVADNINKWKTGCFAKDHSGADPALIIRTRTL